MMGSIRDQTRSRNAILVPQVYTIENSIPLLMVYSMYYCTSENILKYEFIVELASRCANLGMSL
jgi:hypothetical protein